MKKTFLAVLTFTFFFFGANISQASQSYQTNKTSKFGFLSTGIGITPKSAKKMGTSWLRPHIGQAIWENIEKTKGTFTWTKMDKEVKNAQKYNSHLLVTIWPFAKWDQKTCHANLKKAKGFERELPTKRGKPCDYNAYKNFLTKLVERYDGDG